jgi:hypothetical protein
MITIDEDNALSVVFANTKRKKRDVDLITLALNCKSLVELYGSEKELGKKIGLSTSMVRQLLNPLKLPEEIQALVKKREIDSIDIVNQIVTIKNTNDQFTFISKLKNFNSDDTRDLKRFLKDSKLPIDDVKHKIVNEKSKNLHFFIIDFGETEYNFILSKSKEFGIDSTEYVKKLILNEINKNGGD